MIVKVPGFEPGEPLTIINTMSRKIKDEKGRFQELLTLVYKDASTGLKYKTEILDPIYSYYLAKPDKTVGYNRLFIKEEDTVERTVVHKELDKELAKDLGLKEWFHDCINSGNRREIRKIHTHPSVFMSDNNLEDYYRFWFDRTYENDICEITKAYFDIEVDGINMAGDFPEMGECPVNAITIVLQNTMEVYTFLLETSANPLISEFKQYMQAGGINELKQFVYEHVIEQRQHNKKDKNMSLGVENFQYKMLFYKEEDELDMIADFFALINKVKPDFALAWNQAFDIPYLIARCRALGADPAIVMSHPDFEYKYADYYIDERVLNEYAERCDFAIIPSYTVYLDQMIQFASRRKGQTAYTSYSLDYIGEAIAKVRKLDYKNITTNIAELPYIDYKTFVFYNIMDTIVQYCIEAVTGDIDYVFGKAIVNNTRYSKVHRQTVYLANRGMKLFKDDDLIIGNNVNKFNNPPTEKFPGAFVADPTKVSDYSKMRLNGYPVSVFENLYDMDYKSLYPSEIRQNNIAPHTQIGMVQILSQIHNKENRRNIDHWNRGGAFIEDFHSHNWLEVGTRWFNLPDYEKLYNHIMDLFTNTVMPTNRFGFNVNENSIKYYSPVTIREDGYYPVIFTPPMSNELINSMKEWRSHVAQHPNQQF